LSLLSGWACGPVTAISGRHEEVIEAGREGHGYWRVSTMSFLVILVAEFGDLTQIVTANLAAKYQDPISVGIGSVIGLWAVAGLAILGGRGLLRIVPVTWIVRVAAAVMVVLAVFSVASAIRG
jgi:putative Ca2+/H+ antiporter (TMEM165/GDT1 family)